MRDKLNQLAVVKAVNRFIRTDKKMMKLNKLLQNFN